MGTISGHQITTFVSPSNGQTPIDATVVRGNDNTVKSGHNAHDADSTIHVQNGVVATRPAASTAGQMWLASDTGAVYAYLDTGAAWVEWNYLRNTGGTITGTLVVTGATSLASTTATQFIVDNPTDAQIFLVADNGALNQKRWCWINSAGALSLVTYDDASSTSVSALSFARTGTTVTAISLKAATTITTGGLTVTAGGLTVTAGGLTVSAGTTAVQALTATALTSSGFSIFGSMATTGATAPTLCIQNTTAPSAIPSGGGYLYVEAGALKYRGSTGSTTTIAVA